nr:MAG TPA: hypothetical protein [Crassvirales sp.]
MNKWVGWGLARVLVPVGGSSLWVLAGAVVLRRLVSVQ